MQKFSESIEGLVRRGGVALLCGVAAFVSVGCSDDNDEGEPQTVAGEVLPGAPLGMFITSTTQDGDLGGLEGADRICQDLAAAVGAGNRTWRAYLSAENGGNPIHARERIGNGPWYNAAGDLVAEDLDALHSLVGDADLFLDENGAQINGQWNGVSPNEHDIMTGSDSDGMLLMDETTTCNDWTSNTLEPGPQVGHSDGMGPGMNTSEARFTSWNGGHASRGCSLELLRMSGGAGRFYCFAAN